MEAKTTKHSCGGPVFGRLATRGTCPRCDELHAGAVGTVWRKREESVNDRWNRRENARRLAAEREKATLRAMESTDVSADLSTLPALRSILEGGAR